MELFDIVGIIALFSILLFSYSVFSTSKAHSKNLPPTASGAWPIIGHLHLMSNHSHDKLPHITLGAMADEHGSIFGLWLGSRRAVAVSDWELAKELFTTCDRNVSSRPVLMVTKILGYNMAMFGFSPYSRYWRDIRKLISIELLSSRGLNIQRHVFVSEIMLSIKELYQLWDNKKDSSGRTIVEMKGWFGDLNLNVILRMVVGKRYFGSSGSTNEARRCQKVMRDFFRLSGVVTLGDALPYLSWLDIGGHEKKMKETAKELDSLVQKWLEEHRDKAEERQQDFMDVMLAVMQSAKFQTEYDDDTIIKSTCSNLISGASDTTTIMLVWSLSLLVNNPRVLKKAQQELDEHVGRERRVETVDITNFLYLQAIVKETLRMYPAAPLSGTREFTQDCIVGGYDIPKGTWLFTNIWKLQRDPHIWLEDPMEFRPERFLITGKEDINDKSKDFWWIPFGAGRRSCPGAHFGLEMMHLVLANLLHAFDFSTPSDELIDMTESMGMTNSKATPLDVLVVPRLSASLYY